MRKVAGVDRHGADRARHEFGCACRMLRAADQEHASGGSPAQRIDERLPVRGRPILRRVRAAEREHDPGTRRRAITLGDRRQQCGGQARFGSVVGERHIHRGHERAQPVHRQIMEMAPIDPGIGDEQALRPQSHPDALRNPRERRRKRRAHRAVEDPDPAKPRAPQQHHQPREMQAAPQFRAAMLEIGHLGDARLRLQQILRVGRGKRQKRDRAGGLRSPQSRG